MKLSHSVAAGLAAAFLMVTLSVAHAQLYRYKDSRGNWSYTDNLADVPTDQREDCKQYESIQPPAARSPQPEQTQTAKSEAAPEDAGQLREQLQERKAALDQEYDALVNESGELEKLSLNLKSEEAKKSFENRKNTFTQRLKVFEARRQVFEKDLQAYNDIAGHQKN